MSGSTPHADARLHLGDVTLVAVTSVAIPETVRALEACMKHCRFGQVLLLSDRPFSSQNTGMPDGITWRRIAPIRSHGDYSRFMLHDLHRHVTTSHVLCAQWDSFVLRPESWDPAFLDYDYVGAPWPHFDDDMVVGNGGFSLRSRRLLAASATLPTTSNEPEDVMICRTYRPILERDHGLRFAPEHLARRFAFERHAPTGCEFGFHGVFNLVNILPYRTVLSVLRGLEPTVISRSERKELLRWAFRNRRPAAALLILRRMLAAKRK